MKEQVIKEINDTN